MGVDQRSGMWGVSEMGIGSEEVFISKGHGSQSHDQQVLQSHNDVVSITEHQ